MTAIRRVMSVVWCAVALGVLPAPLLAQTADVDADREIAPLTGDLYRVRDGHQHTVFLVTPDGIVVADPLNTPTAMWLKKEFAARFPGRPVRFVLLTHHHFDRAEDGGIFQPAERIAHRNFNGQLSRARTVLPSFVDAVNGNRDGVLDGGELANPSSGPLLLSRDRDGDRRVSPDELYRRVVGVRRTYDRTLNVALGERTIQMIHPGAAHASDMTVLFFPAERVVFASDPPPIAEVPFVFGSWRPSQVFDWIHAVAPLDFHTLLFGDGTTMSRAQLMALATYLDALREEVAAGYEQGLTPSQLRAVKATSPSLHGVARGEQIAAIYPSLRLVRIVLAASGGAVYAPHSAGFCELSAICSTGGAVSAGSAALNVSVGRMGVGAELQMGAQSWHARTSALRDEEFALRETRVAVLVRYGRLQRGLSFNLAGGPSFFVGESKGMYREKAALAPLGGRHPLAAREMRIGVTGGVDLVRSLGPRFSLTVPIRVTRLMGAEQDSWPGKTTIAVAGGVSMRIARRGH